MGLIAWRKFSSIPSFQEKLKAKARQREQFTPTRTEFGSKPVRRQITKSDFVLNAVAQNVVFTVPEGRILFIHSAYLVAETRQATRVTNLIRVPVLGGADRDILSCTASTNNSNAVNIVFPGGLRVESGTVEHHTSNPALTSEFRMGFYGILEEETEFV